MPAAKPEDLARRRIKDYTKGVATNDGADEGGRGRGDDGEY